MSAGVQKSIIKGWAERLDLPDPSAEACPSCKADFTEDAICCFCNNCLEGCCDCPEWLEVAN
jgi:predicted amidophosphoribosyltransferase